MGGGRCGSGGRWGGGRGGGLWRAEVEVGGEGTGKGED